MKLFLCLIVWLVALAFSPLVAIAALVLFPILWLLSLPIRVVRRWSSQYSRAS